MSFIGPSNWTASMCRKSLIGKNVLVQVISNIIDPAIRFHREWRKQHKRFTILFCAFGGRRNSFKGWNDLEAAIHIFSGRIARKEDICVNVCGEDADDYEYDGIKIHFCGTITDSAQLCHIYHSTDLLAFPSKQETQGMVKNEALLCGVPVVTFKRTACAEGIVHGKTGWIAEDGDVESYADGIQKYYDLFCRNAISYEGIAKSAEYLLASTRTVASILMIYSSH